MALYKQFKGGDNSGVYCIVESWKESVVIKLLQLKGKRAEYTLVAFVPKIELQPVYKSLISGSFDIHYPQGYKHWGRGRRNHCKRWADELVGGQEVRLFSFERSRRDPKGFALVLSCFAGGPQRKSKLKLKKSLVFQLSAREALEMLEAITGNQRELPTPERPSGGGRKEKTKMAKKSGKPEILDLFEVEARESGEEIPLQTKEEIRTCTCIARMYRFGEDAANLNIFGAPDQLFVLWLDESLRPISTKKVKQRSRITRDFHGRPLLEKVVNLGDVIHDRPPHAVGVAFVHAHPAEEVPVPSGRDIVSHRRLEEICTRGGLYVFDHLILGTTGFFSFRDKTRYQGFGKGVG